MKKFICTIPRVVLKLFAMLLSPILRLLVWVSKIAAFVLSYGFVGLSILCLIGAGAEFITIGVTREAFEYLVLAGLSYLMRWGILHLVPFLLMLQEYVEQFAATPIYGHRYDSYHIDEHYSYY